MYVILWEYVVAPGEANDFVRAYGPDGVWAELFGRAEGFLGVELYQQEDETARYLTIDRWRTAEDFEGFKAQFGPEYHRLDDELGHLTLEEDRIGAFAAA